MRCLVPALMRDVIRPRGTTRPWVLPGIARIVIQPSPGQIQPMICQLLPLGRQPPVVVEQPGEVVLEVAVAADICSMAVIG